MRAAPWNTQTAGAAALRRWQLCRARQAEEPEQDANGLPYPYSPVNGREHARQHPRIGLVREQINRTCDVLRGELEPRDRAALITALDRLLDRERVLLDVPLPGSRKPSQASPYRSTVAPLPE
jgi:hypothetical protein